MDPARLKALPLFSTLSKRELQELAHCTDDIDVAEGKHLIDEGRSAYEFFVIEEGTAEVMHGDEHVADLGPGDFFGEIGSLSQEHRRTASVLARSPMRVVVMTDYDLRHLSRESPAIAGKLQRAMDHRTAAQG